MTKSLKLHDDIILESDHDSKPILADARYIPNNERKPVILFLHGFKGFKDWGSFNLIADEMARHGFVFVKFNLSHNGTTPEHPVDFVDLEAFSENNFSIELDDTGKVINYLFSQDCVVSSSEMNLNKLFLMGHSRGGGLALLKAHEDSRIKAVATMAAVNDFKRWTENVMKEWKKNGVHYIHNSRTNQNMPIKYQITQDLENNLSRLHIPDAVKNLNIPLLIVHGTNDETVSVADAKQLHQWNPGSKLLLIEGTDHVFGGRHPYESDTLPEDTLTALEQAVIFFKQI